MDLCNVHKTVEGEFNTTIATLVVAALTVNLTTKAKQKDMLDPGRFTNRINQKTRDLLWEHNKDDIELAIKIRDAWTEYSNRQSFDGLGGCEKKTLQEIVFG